MTDVSRDTGSVMVKTTVEMDPMKMLAVISAVVHEVRYLLFR